MGEDGMGEQPGVVADPSNDAQAGAWDGDAGDYWTRNADRFEAGVAGFHDVLLRAADVGDAETVLDVGCGAGRTSRDAARRARRGRVLGIDLSSGMLGLARERAVAEGVDNVEFRHADAQVHAFDAAAYDLVLSRNGAMFFGDPPAAFANLRAALRPGGRLALLAWQPPEHNEWLRTFFAILGGGHPEAPAPPSAMAPGPFGLCDPDAVRALLSGAGFAAVRVEDVRAPMWWGEDVGDAHAFVTGQFGGVGDVLDDAARAAAHERLRADLAAHRTDHGVLYDAAAWLILARRP